MGSLHATKNRSQQRLEIASNLAGSSSNVFGFCVGGFMLLCLYHGDYRMIGFLSLFMLAALANRVLNGLLTKEQSLITLHIINIGAVLTFQYLLVPEAAVGPILVFAITTMWGSRRISEFLIVSSILLSGRYLMMRFGVPQGIDTLVPTEQYAAVAILASLLGTYQSIKHIMEATTKSQAQLASSTAQLGYEEAHLQDVSHELKAINRKIEFQNSQVSAQLSRVQALRNELRQKRSSEQDLVKAIHHDLREPLRSIVSFTQLIRRRLRNKGVEVCVEEYLSYAEDGGQRMSVMLRDILRYAQEKDKTSELIAVDLNQLTQAVQFNLGDQLQRSGAKLSFSKLPTIRGYETQLTQLFQNIISNAIKFRRPGVTPVVIVGWNADYDDESACIFFKDNGIGIDATQIDKVFGLFNRVHAKNNYEGSGVGLALCRRIAIAHQGELSVSSEVGMGTTFYFLLPKLMLCDNDTTVSPKAHEVKNQSLRL